MKKIPKEKKVVFIDLDDTLIEPFSGSNFPKCIADMKLIWKTWNALRDWANGRNDWRVYIVSNQGGIAKGLVDKKLWMKKVEYICAALYEYLGKGNGIVNYTYCTDDNKSNPMRKPNPGMLSYFWRECQESGITDLSQAVMIGDAAGKTGDFSDSDLKAAENFGIDFIDVDDL